MKRKIPTFKAISVPEILVAIALFSVAIVGIYMASSRAQMAISKGMNADVEAAIANIKIAEVNPYDLNVDTAYDAPATYTTGKQTYTLPNGQKVYWTRTVTSDNTSGDVKQVSVYLFKNSTDSTPYRKFRKDIVLERQSYILSDSTTMTNSYYKDPTGTVWTRMDNNAWSIVASGDKHRPGPDQTGNNSFYPTSTSITTAGSVLDTTMWARSHVANGSYPSHLVYTIPATQNQTYLIKLGFCECAAAAVGARVMKVVINNVTQDSSVDIRQLAGLNKGVVRLYRSSAMNLGSGVYGLKIDLDQNGSSASPMLLNIQIERDTTQ